MLDDIQKTIKSILYDRVANPLSNSFILAWTIWNWRIPYATIFIDSTDFEQSKLEYIQSQLNWINGLLYPSITTIFLLTLYPFLSEQAYKLWLFHKNRKQNLKEANESKRRLTIEQSIEIRLLLKSQEEKFEKITDDKNKEIQLLKEENERLISKLNDLTTKTEVISKKYDDKEDKIDTTDIDFQHLNSQNALIEVLGYIHKTGVISADYDFAQKHKNEIKELELLDLVEPKKTSYGNEGFSVTKKGRQYLKKILLDYKK